MNTLYNINTYQLPIGYNIIGKWNGRCYKVIRLLGSGENGTVYLVKNDNSLYALKMGDSTYDLSYEVQAIKRLNETQGIFLGFSIFDIDDFLFKEKMYTYYVMPYQKGITLKNYLFGKNSKEYLNIYKKVAAILKNIHNDGWVFGDLKSEHILINPDNKEVSLIDYGGLTVIGEGIRQYTEVYDRGNWKVGTRKADPHYDLFSLTMIFIQLGIGEKKFLKIYNRTRSLDELYDIIQKVNNLNYLESLFIEIISGKIRNVDELLKVINNININKQFKNNNNWINILLTGSLILFVLLFVKFLYS